MCQRMFFVAASLCLVFTCSASPARAEGEENETVPLFEFEDSTESNWSVVNDGVMGGRSKGYREVAGGIGDFGRNFRLHHKVDPLELWCPLCLVYIPL